MAILLLGKVVSHKAIALRQWRFLMSKTPANIEDYAYNIDMPVFAGI